MELLFAPEQNVMNKNKDVLKFLVYMTKISKVVFNFVFSIKMFVLELKFYGFCRDFNCVNNLKRN